MTTFWRISVALIFGALCHITFAMGVGLMIYHLYFGLSGSWGTVAAPYSILINALLILQFPLLHTVLLTPKGRRLLSRIGPDARLATTHYAAIASVQLVLTFACWTPSGLIIWQADGIMYWVMTAAYVGAWSLLGISILQSGFQLQSGMLGWFAMLRDKAPRFPGLPTGGLYRVIRQPIYVSFALTLWTMPTYTPDQLALAIIWTIYCVAAPRHKEQRFTQIFGDQFITYQARVPYALPLPRKVKPR